MWALQVFNLYAEREQIDQVERERLEHQVRVVHDNLSKRLQITSNALDAIRSDLNWMLADPDMLNSRLRAMAAATIGVRSFLVVDVNGDVIASNRPEANGVNLRETERYRTIREGGNPDMLYLSAPFVTPLKVWAMSAGKVIPDAQGRFAGYVQAIMDPEYFSLLMRSVLFAPDMRAAVIHADGKVVLREPDPEGLTGQDLGAMANSIFVRYLQLGQPNAVIEAVSGATGEPLIAMLSAVRPESTPSDKALVFAISRNRDDILAPWHRQALERTGMLGVLSVASVLMMLFYQRRQSAFARIRAEQQSEREHAAEQLRQRERFSAETMDAIGALLCVLDRNGRITLVNAAWRRFCEANALTGHGHAGECVGDDYLQGRIPGLPAEAQETRSAVHGMGRLLRGSEREFMLEYPCQTPTQPCWMQLTARVFDDGSGNVVVMHEDITARKLAEIQLHLSDERMRLALEGARLGAFHWDMTTNEIVWSDTYRQIFGLPPHAHPNYDDWLASVHPEDRELADTAVRHAQAGHEDFEVEYRIIWPDGSLHWIQARGRFFYGDDGLPLRMEGVVVDITLRKDAEAALRRAKAEVEAANQAKSSFLSNMSHELRTPLNAMIGFVSMAQSGTLTPRQQELLRQAQTASRQLLSLIDDLLDFVRLDTATLSLEHQDFELGTTLDLVLGRIREKAVAKGLKLSLELGADVPRLVRGDAVQLGQILHKLGDNAIKFTEAGEVWLAVKAQERLDGEVLLRFEMSDTGIGLSEEQQACLFQSFQQSDASLTRKHGGTGIGLAIARRLVELMGGQIGVESQPGVGSRFWFTVRLGLVQKTEPPGAAQSALSADPQPTVPEAAPSGVAPVQTPVSGLAAEVVDAGGWEPVRRQLMAMLADDDANSLQFCNDHAELLRAGLGERYDAFNRAVQGFNFEAAVALMN